MVTLIGCQSHRNLLLLIAFKMMWYLVDLCRKGMICWNCRLKLGNFMIFSQFLYLWRRSKGESIFLEAWIMSPASQLWMIYCYREYEELQDFDQALNLWLPLQAHGDWDKLPLSFKWICYALDNQFFQSTDRNVVYFISTTEPNRYNLKDLNGVGINFSKDGGLNPQIVAIAKF